MKPTEKTSDTGVIEKILTMEQACFDDPWKSVSLNDDSVYIVEDYGYAIGTPCELYRIAVLPEHRKKGLASSLLKRFLEKCNGEVFLEVAAKNICAVELYKKHGFTEIARRKGYYQDDDAIVMVCENTIAPRASTQT